MVTKIRKLKVLSFTQSTASIKNQTKIDPNAGQIAPIIHHSLIIHSLQPALRLNSLEGNANPSLGEALLKPKTDSLRSY